MQFWQENVNKFAKLYQLHLKYHCIPATSAAMERCFGAVGYIVNAQPRRSSLTVRVMLEDSIMQQRLYGQVKCSVSFGLT